MEALGKLQFMFQRQGSGETDVSVVGNLPEVGAWNSDLGLPLVRTGTTTWGLTSPITLPVGVRLEYKYVFVIKGLLEWETLPVNRCVVVAEGLLHVEDSEGSLQSTQRLTAHSSAPMRTRALSNDFLQADLSYSAEDPVVIASMLLPIQVSRNPDYPQVQDSEKWLFTGTTGLWLPTLFDLAGESMQFKWVGHVEYWTESEEEQAELSHLLLSRFNCCPLFLPSALLTAHLDFCSNILFPIFHNVIHTSAAELPQYSADRWEAYRQVNLRFAEKVADQLTSNTLLWVNDYQLLLLPSFVSRLVKEPVTIGLYFHTPFPSSEVYKILPHRSALLHSILCCDLLGFHLFEYARHFLTSCQRLVGAKHKCLPGGYLGVEFFGRIITVWVGHLGVEPRMLATQFEADGKDSYEDLQKKYRGKVLLLGIDPLQTYSGIALKLAAFKELYQELPSHLQSRVRLLQVLTPPRHTNTVNTEVHRAELRDMASAFSAELGSDVITVIERNLTRGERLGYLKAANILLVTCIRDGINLLPLEFIMLKAQEAATVILSEFSGVSRAITSPLRINPFNSTELKEAIYEAISQTQPPPKVQHDYIYIQEHSAQKWATSFLSDLKKARKDPTKFQYFLSGAGDQMKLLALGRDYAHLDSAMLLDIYRKARNRVLFLDSEGTISAQLTGNTQPSGHYERNLMLLEELLKDDRNTTFIISGKGKSALEAYYESLPGLGLVAEDGALIRVTQRQAWELLPDVNGVWKSIAEDVVESYVSRTEGAVCEVKDTSVVFQYRGADPEYGEWQAKELIAQLEMILKSYEDACEIGEGKGYVEVKPRGFTKGSALRLTCDRLKARKGEIDFLLAVGDDVNDESMFREVAVMQAGGLPNALAVSIGKKPSLAQYYLNDSSELTSVLETLQRASLKVGRFYSQLNLASLA
jgi:trehalose 6-phosphate synthase/phosphatase